jgi:anti-sigma factor RsiW
MDVLLTFYLEGDLSISLKTQVEEHLKNCASCRAKYDIIKSMFADIKSSLDTKNNDNTSSQQYRLFKNNLSAYLDNELSNDENIKIKKFTINNDKARKELEENYNIRRLMNHSFNKTKSELRNDFSRSILKQLESEEDSNFGIHPAIKLLISFTLLVLVITSFVLISLS